MNFDYYLIVIFLIILAFFCVNLICEQKIMEITERIFQIGHFVYAKMRGSPPWPALILDIRGRMACVRFLAWFDHQW